MTFQSYSSYSDFSCTQIMCHSDTSLVFVRYSDSTEGDFFLVTQFERDPDQRRKILGRETTIAIKGQIRIKQIRNADFTISLFDPETEVYVRTYNTDDLIFKGLDSKHPLNTHLVSFSYVWLEAGVATKDYLGTSYIQFKSINDLSDQNLVTDRIYLRVNDPKNDLKLSVRKQLTYKELRHHIPLKFKFYDYISIDKGNGMMFEESSSLSDFEFLTEPRSPKLKNTSNILGVFWNQERLLPAPQLLYIAVLRAEEDSKEKTGQIIEIFEYGTQKKIYSLSVQMKCLELSFSVIKVD